MPEYQRLLPLFQTARWLRRDAPEEDPEYQACASPVPSFS
jgi:hypothetical protein